ncbi:hypothetical protein VTP01DRAFT_4284 [Rhizomucor pusillus]|uniref:uncharacterized protein n=1 Tax=Rhizomucor pusillus TaxID=4840 RepID=UPI003742EDE1
MPPSLQTTPISDLLSHLLLQNPTADNSIQSQAHSEAETAQEQQILPQVASQSAVTLNVRKVPQLLPPRVKLVQYPESASGKIDCLQETPEQGLDRVTAERVKRRRKYIDKQLAEEEVVIPNDPADDEDCEECRQEYRREYSDDTSKQDERMANYKERKEEHRLSDNEEYYENSEVIQEGDAFNNIENNERAMEQLQAVAMEEEGAEKQRARELNLTQSSLNHLWMRINAMGGYYQ